MTLTLKEMRELAKKAALKRLEEEGEVIDVSLVRTANNEGTTHKNSWEQKEKARKNKSGDIFDDESLFNDEQKDMW